MRFEVPILFGAILLAGCTAPSASVGPVADLRDLEETTTFEAEFRAMVASRIPGQGTPCGGLTVGYAEGLGDEWTLPPWSQTADLRMETNAVANPLSFRLCLLHQDGREELSRGPAPLELHADVAGNETVQLFAAPDEESPSPQGPQTITITATARGRG